MAVSLVKAVLTNGGTVVRVCRCRRDVFRRRLGDGDQGRTVDWVGRLGWATTGVSLALDEMQEKWTALDRAQTSK